MILETNTSANPELAQALIDINLRGIVSCLDDYLVKVKKEKLGPEQQLEELIRIEKADRGKRSLESRMRRSGIRTFKPMLDFDWNWPSKIERDLVERALDLQFVERGDNIIVVGAHGLGKTTIVKNIAYQAVLAGYRVLFITAAKMLNNLAAQDSPSGLERRIRYYSSIRVLAIDELGYLSYDNKAGDLLFEVVSRRHENKKPILMSTNLAFKDWDTVFPNATSTVALIDRLTHHADIIKIQGDSWRRKEAMERQSNSRRTSQTKSKSSKSKKKSGGGDQ